jgi:hypothetical protein
MSCSSLDSKQLAELRTQIRQLIKFVALNYLAVVKAIKKRNRHCKVCWDTEAAVLCVCGGPFGYTSFALCSCSRHPLMQLLKLTHGT